MAFLHYKYQKLGKIESLCIAFFSLMDSTSSKKDLEQSRRVSLAVAHNQMAADICGRYGGRVVKNIGDLLIAAFNTPLEGMLASLELVEKIDREKLLFRTKSVFSHGIVTKIDNNGTDYIGNAVDRCSRLIDHALPSQILTDESTMEMIKPFIKSFNEMVSRFIGVKNLSGVGKVPIYEVAMESLGFVDESVQPPLEETGGPLNSPAGIEDASLELSEPDLPPLAVPCSAQVPVLDRQLEGILDQCTLAESELEAVSAGYRNLCHILEKAYDMYVRQVHYSGSFSRGAMIRPMQSVDIIAVMSPPRGQEKSVPETLEDFKRFLSRESPGTEMVSSRGRIGVVTHGVEFDIIPVLAAMEKGKVQLFIPSTEGGFWLARNPAAPELWMKKAAEKNGPAFLPFLRLVKAWQRSNCSYINNLHLELLTDIIASRVNLGLSFESVYLWFRNAYTLMTQNKSPFIADPGKPGSYIDDYIYSNINTFGRFSRVLTESFSLAKQGINYHRAGDVKAATAHWKALFGSYMTD
ncbi:MAG: hypothetical protein M1609_11160 [Firmicutes bacterium]|nr:hypothetical protein [Bacillota bacterium]MCL5057445.1 hypothetical protein [Actinomycetota bacterium]